MDKKPSLLDLSNSTLKIEGTVKEQKAWSKKIKDFDRELETDRSERKNIYAKRRDFYSGNQGDYSNIIGIVRDTKQKKGHTNQVTNYAGKITFKMALGIANNPPKFVLGREVLGDDFEEIHAQAVEDYMDTVFNHKRNRFWKSTFRRAAIQQGEFGDFAIKTFIEYDENGKPFIRIIGHDDLSTLKVGWNGNPDEFDFVIADMYLTPQSVEDKYGIKVNEQVLGKIAPTDLNRPTGSWQTNNEWASKNTDRPGQTDLPSGKNLMPKVKVQEFDSAECYAIKIEGELVQLIFKDDITFPKIKFWSIGHNVPNPPSPWSIADIDYIMEKQIELNENDNRSSDHLRVGNVQRYVAYNMNDFDPESLKTSSGQVIFVNDPDGKSKFEPLQTNINNFPDDQYYQRTMSEIYDLGLPRINFGNMIGGRNSGRALAVDFQSSIDFTTFKRDSWELVLQDIAEKLQVFGNFILGKDYDWFENSDGDFVVRNVEFDWEELLPTTSSDKIVNIANKYNMIGLSLRQAYRELGYRNPDAMIAELKKELKDPDLMVLRAKSWQLSGGILQATSDAEAQHPQDKGTGAKVNVSVSADASTPEGQSILEDAGVIPQGQEDQGEGTGVPLPSNQPPPMLNGSQAGAKPMASKGGTTAYSSATGTINQTTQNRNAMK